MSVVFLSRGRGGGTRVDVRGGLDEAVAAARRGEHVAGHGGPCVVRLRVMHRARYVTRLAVQRLWLG